MDDETRAAIAALNEKIDGLIRLLTQPQGNEITRQVRVNTPVHPEMHAPRFDTAELDGVQ